MRRSYVFLSLLFVCSLALALHWANQGLMPMTEERYADLCGNKPECYPEIGYLLGSLVMALFVLFSGAGLLVQWLLDRLSHARR